MIPRDPRRAIGIIGLGRIGKEVVIRARAFGMETIAFDVYWDEAFAKQHGVKRAANLDEIFAVSDYISLHTNLTPETRDLVSAKNIAKMKKGVLILNCARGEIVNTADMVAALQSGQVGGYGTDVLDEEPPKPDHPLLRLPNCIVTPPASPPAPTKAWERRISTSVQNLLKAAKGEKPLAQVNPEVPTSKMQNPPMSEVFYVVPEKQHNSLVEAAYRHRGYLADEAAEGARFLPAEATRHGDPHPQRPQGASSRPPVRQRLEGLRPRGEDRGEALALSRRPGLERQQEAGPVGRLPGDGRGHEARGQVRLRHDLGRQCLPLSLGRRLRDGCRPEGLHIAYTNCTRLAGRGRSVRRQIPHSWDQSPTAGAFPPPRRSATPSSSTGPRPSSPWAACSN